MIIFSLCVLISCGPSASELALRKRILEDSVQQEQAIYVGLQNRLTYLTAKITTARDRLETIRQPQFLRTPAEREQQIFDQSVVITELETEIEDLQRELTKEQTVIAALEKSIRTLPD